MTIDEEIMLGKYERELNKQVKELVESIDFSDGSEAGLLNLKYSKTAEMLREFKYDEAIFEALKESRDYEKMDALEEEVVAAFEEISSSDILKVKKGYTALAEKYLRLSDKENAKYL